MGSDAISVDDRFPTQAVLVQVLAKAVGVVDDGALDARAIEEVERLEPLFGQQIRQVDVLANRCAICVLLHPAQPLDLRVDLRRCTGQGSRRTRLRRIAAPANHRHRETAHKLPNGCSSQQHPVSSRLALELLGKCSPCRGFGSLSRDG